MSYREALKKDMRPIEGRPSRNATEEELAFLDKIKIFHVMHQAFDGNSKEAYLSCKQLLKCRLTGAIQYWNKDKGFGFVLPSRESIGDVSMISKQLEVEYNKGSGIFIHASRVVSVSASGRAVVVEPNLIHDVSKGAQVAYTLGIGKGGKLCCKLMLVTYGEDLIQRAYDEALKQPLYRAIYREGTDNKSKLYTPGSYQYYRYITGDVQDLTEVTCDYDIYSGRDWEFGIQVLRDGEWVPCEDPRQPEVYTVNKSRARRSKKRG